VEGPVGPDPLTPEPVLESAPVGMVVGGPPT